MNTRAAPATSREPEIPVLLTRADVAALLGVRLKLLTWWIWALDRDRRYDSFEITRRNGEARTIDAPIKPIKDMQRRLATLLADWYAPPVHVHGFVRSRGILTNAEQHRRQQWVLRIDLKDYFPSINFGRVRGMFMAYPFEFGPEAATTLAQLCCFRNRLPQGAPTSPMVANFITRGMDSELARLARAERCRYTRYADDLTFSTDRTVFPANLAVRDGANARVEKDISDIIAKHGFVINESKTRLVRKTQRQRVTGVVVNKKLNLSREYLRSLRNLLYIWETHGEDVAKQAFLRTEPHPNWPPGKAAPEFAAMIRGRIQHVGHVKGWNNGVYLTLNDAFARASGQPARREPKMKPAVRRALNVCTEGKTDILHLRAAQRHFHGRGEFTSFELRFDEGANLASDVKLKRHLETLPAEWPSVPTVCLFDRDNQQMLEELGLRQADWVDRGNGVVAATIVAPEFRADPCCIEMLYPNTVLQRPDKEGRRIYLLEEFDRQTGQHRSEDCNIADRKSKTLVRDDVYEYRTRRPLARSKSAFAQGIADGLEGLGDQDFEGFRPTFEMLEQALDAVGDKVAKAAG